MADGTVSKVTALPEGCTLALFDSSGGVSKIDAQKFMELVRGSIQIGGRNLLKGTAVELTTENRNYELTTDLSKELPGTPVTCSFEYEYSGITSTPESRFGMQVAIKQRNGWQEYVECLCTEPRTSTSGRGRAVATKILPEGMDISKKDMLVFSQHITGGNVRIFNMKLERGNIATDWTPAPEDFGGGKIALYPISYATLFAAAVEAAHHSEERRAA